MAASIITPAAAALSDSLAIQIKGKDTFYLAYLHDVYVYPKMVFKNKKQERFYWKTVRDVKKTLPYAKMITKDMAYADAEMAKIAAEADLEVVKIQADAALYAGEREANMNQRIAEALSDELINYYWIKQWNGELPSTMLGENTSIMLTLNEEEG